MNKNENEILKDEQFTEKDIENIFGGASVLAESFSDDGINNREDQTKQMEQYTHASDNIS